MAEVMREFSVRGKRWDATPNSHWAFAFLG
jgi:hypothetical protein